MPSAIVLTSDERIIVKAFHEAIAELVREEDAGVAISISELQRAAERLERVSPQLRRAAWSDVLDVSEFSLPTSFVTSLKRTLSTMPEGIRSHNRYTRTSEQKLISSNLRYDIRMAAELESKKIALTESLSQYILDDSPEQKRLLTRLLDLVASCKNKSDVALIRRSWDTVLADKEGEKYHVDPERVRTLEKTLREFQAKGSVRSTLEEKVAQLRAHMDDVVVHPQAAISAEEVEKRLADMMHTDGTQRMLLDSAKMRMKAYRSTVDNLFNDKTVKRIVPDIKRAMEEDEDEYRAEQAVSSGLVLDASNVETLGVAYTYSKPVFDLTQEVAKKLGFTKEVTLVISPHVMPNAFVYTADIEKPRVTFFTPMIEKFWNPKTNDWVKLWITKEGKPCEPGTEGAREMPIGRYMLESVLAHELGHIRDQIVLTSTVLIYMFLEYGRTMISTCTPDQKATLMQQLNEAYSMLGQCPSHADHAHHDAPLPAFSTTIPHTPLAGRLSHEEMGEVLRKATDSILAVEAEGVSEATVSTRPDTSFDFGSILRFILALRSLSRAAEATADRYAVIEQDTPEWTALLDSMLSLQLAPNATESQKLDALKRLLSVGAERFADQMLQLGAREAKETHKMGFDAGRTHPVSAARIKQVYLFDRDENSLAAQLRKYKSLSSYMKLLSVIQLYEKSLKPLDREVEPIKPHDTYDLLGDLGKQRILEGKIKEIEDKMKPYLDLADALATDESFLDEDSDFVARAMTFISEKGILLGDKTPFRRLAQRWHDRLEKILGTDDEDRLTPDQRRIGTERLRKLRSVIQPYLKTAEEESGALKRVAPWAAETTPHETHGASAGAGSGSLMASSD
jgi:hypothetical protein